MEDGVYIEQVRAGNTAQFAVLVERYKDFVYTITLRILRNSEDAEEVAQDTFLKAYQQLDTFQGNAKFSTWLYTIAYRLAISKTRKKKIPTTEVEDFVQESLSVDRASPLEILSDKEQTGIVKEAINRLPELDSLIISLYYLEESSIAEIVEITGLSQSNVKVKLHRARKKLQSDLKVVLKNEMEVQ